MYYCPVQMSGDLIPGLKVLMVLKGKFGTDSVNNNAPLNVVST